MKSGILQRIRRLTNEQYLFWVTLSFYILLLVINPSNYFIVFSFIFLFLAYYLKIKNFKASLFFVFVSSLIVETGKTYPIQLLPAGIFPIEIFPQGYFSNLVIRTTHFIAFAMLFYIIRQSILKPHTIKPNKIDLLLVVFYSLKLLSAILASKEPQLSLPFEILSLSNLVAYFYAKFFIKSDFALWKNLSFILAALVLFESLLGFSQLAMKSPLGKKIESQVNIEYFGNTVDETQFTFRPVGTFDHANALGIWVSAMCLYLLAASLKNRSNLLWLSFFTGSALMITTVSRSAWLGFSAGFFFFIIYTAKKSKNLFKPIFNFVSRWRFIIIPILLFLFIFFIIPRAENSLYSFQNDAGAGFFRRIQIRDALEVIKLHPVLGVGALMSVYEGISLNLYTMTASVPLQVHNWYLDVAVENGLLTLFVFMFFLILSLKKISESKNNFWNYISITGVIICSFVAGYFQPYINFVFVLLLLSLKNGDSIILTNDKKYH